MKKRGILIALLALVVAIVAYGIYYTCATADARSMLRSPHGELEWLRAMFDLDDVQFAQIEALHECHAARCAEVSRKLEASNAEAARLIAVNGTVTPVIENALAKVTSAEKECREAMLEHIYAVSAVMSSESGARYIEIMKTHVVRPGLARHELTNWHSDHGS